MITKCFNPACQAPFDYRAGRLVRFSGKNQKGGQEENLPHIEHFWLCAECSTRYKFEYKAGMPVELVVDQKVISKERRYYLAMSA